MVLGSVVAVEPLLSVVLVVVPKKVDKGIRNGVLVAVEVVELKAVVALVGLLLLLLFTDVPVV